MNDAQFCRDNGWAIGTRIVGDEGFGPTVIEITALGETTVLAKTITHNGEVPVWNRGERIWGLDCRDWQPAEVPA